MPDTDRVDVTPNHIGAIGEALFAAMYGPPPLVRQLVLEYCETVAPGWVPLDNLAIQSRRDEHMHVVKLSDEVLKWKRDGAITARYSPIGDERERLEDELGMLSPRWSCEFPVELKTGASAALGRNQRTVMEYLADQSGIQPVFLRFGIDALPDAFTVEEIELVGRD